MVGQNLILYVMYFDIHMNCIYVFYILYELYICILILKIF